MSEYQKARKAAQVIGRRTKLRPRIGLVLGSGLGAFADHLTDAKAISYRAIPGFAVSTAVGHVGQLVIGKCKGVPVAVMQGRVHCYEGYGMDKVVLPVRTLRQFGVETMVFTNAAGGINRKLRERGLMLMTDHINLMGTNPLTGKNEEKLGTRFPDMTEAYSVKMRKLAKRAARTCKVRLFEGVYAAMHGPSYETPAEIGMLKRLGADAVGMSTVPEVIAANHMGMDVVGISVVTNMAAGLSGKKINHEEVLETGRKVEKQFTRLLETLIPALAQVLSQARK